MNYTSAEQTADLAGLIRAVFNAWRSNSIEFLVLRNYDGLPDRPGNDIDVLLRPNALALAEQSLVATANRCGYRLHNRAEFTSLALYFHHPGSRAQIQFDLYHTLRWKSFSLLSEHAVLDWRAQGELFSRPHRIHEAINNLLTRQIYHGHVKENYRAGILTAARTYPAEMETLLQRLFGKDVGKKLFSAIANERWTDAEALTGAMRRQIRWRRIVQQPLRTLRATAGNFARLFHRLLRPPGITVVFLGVDGSGKSTIATHVIEALKTSFPPDKGRRIHWKPAVLSGQRREQRAPTTDPHGQTPRSFPASLLALLFHWSEFFIGAFTQILPVRFRNGMVIVDRYHYDFIVDPRRYRLRSLPGLTRALFALVPKPDLVVLLDAPPEVLHTRKQEVPMEETRRQREAYLKLIKTLPNARVVTCDQPLEKVTDAVTGEVLNYLASRQTRANRA